MYIVLLTFGMIRLVQLFKGEGPIVSLRTADHVYSDPLDTLDVKNENLMIAFAVRDFQTKKALESPAHLQWYAHVFKGNGNKDWIDQDIPIRKCNDEDYDKFYPRKRATKKLFD